MTSNLAGRVWQHQNHCVPGLTQKYNVENLVWYEVHETMESAITREKQLKAGSRVRKLALIEALNPAWRNLYDDIC